jgi:hypothetical protein
VKSKLLVGKGKKGKKADSPSEPSSDSGGEGPPVRGGAIRNLGLLRMAPDNSSGTAGLVPTVDGVPWDAHLRPPNLLPTGCPSIGIFLLTCAGCF